MSEYKKYKSMPNAHLLLSSLRSVGYTEDTAIADILDNCISAGADIIKIKFDWKYKRIIIVDNGSGMQENELLNAMRIGSANPNDNRLDIDLGRFGMGMKTASFSLGKKLLVVTKYHNTIANACWDLNRIELDNEWNLYIEDNKCEIVSFATSELDKFENGTAIIISDLDRLIDCNNIEKSKNRFYNIIKKVKKHLSLVFHRFIEEDGICIEVNNNVINPWNPFLINNRATQELASEIYEEKEVLVQPYILPHKTKFATEDDYNNAGGIKGWLNSQGFYVYRNRRLIAYGTWFGKIRKEYSFNLARIKLDISSKYDFDWKIDIKKSKAVPPVYLDDLISNVIYRSTEKSTKIYNSRGAYGKRKKNINENLKFVWEQKKDSTGRTMFFLNKNHPLLTNLISELNDDIKKQLKAYLALVENYSPIVISGLSDSIKNLNIDSVKNIHEMDKLKIQEYCKIYKKLKFEKEEIIDVILNMKEYSYVEKNTLLEIIEGVYYD